MFGIGCAENGLAGDEDAGARGDDTWRGIQVDAAVDFDGRRGIAGTIERGANLSDLRFAPRNEALAAEARVHRHHQHEVDISGDLFECDDRRRWIEDDPGFDAECFDGMSEMSEPTSGESASTR